MQPRTLLGAILGATTITCALSAKAEPLDNAGVVTFAQKHGGSSMVKGDFETVAQRAARLAILARDAAIVFKPAHSSYAPTYAYDAENKVLSITFQPSSSIAHYQLFERPAQPTTREDAKSYSDVTMRHYPELELASKSEKPSEYIGSSAFGVKAKVTRLSSEEWGVALIHVDKKQLQDVKLQFSVEPARAKQIADNMHWRIQGRLVSGVGQTRTSSTQGEWLIRDSYYRGATIDSLITFVSTRRFAPFEVSRIEPLDGPTGQMLQAIKVGD